MNMLQEISQVGRGMKCLPEEIWSRNTKVETIWQKWFCKPEVAWSEIWKKYVDWVLTGWSMHWNTEALDSRLGKGVRRQAGLHRPLVPEAHREWLHSRWCPT